MRVPKSALGSIPLGILNYPTEEEFKNHVLARALFYGWRRAHFRPARTRDGWRTAVEGDGEGWPDVLALREAFLLVAELKMPGKKPTPAQEAWLEAFRRVGAQTFVWRPEDCLEIERILKGCS